MDLYNGENSRYIGLLVTLGKMGALKRPIEITTAELGKELSVSQQTASRWLRKLTSFRWIVTKRTVNGNLVQITELGKEILNEIYMDLWVVLHGALHKETGRELILSGIVTQGLGEGKYYMSLDGYVKQFISTLGFKPYPGTLNLTITDGIDELGNVPPELISGFYHDGRRLGDVHAWPALLTIKEKKVAIPCAVIRPVRTHHTTNIVEVIAEEYIRGKYGVKDGQELLIVIK